MRRLVAPLCRPVLAVSLLVLPLAACGGQDSGAASEAASSEASGAGSAGEGLPGVEGAYGEKPTLSVPEGDPATELQSAVLSDGEGPEVASGDLLVVDYLGQI